LPALKSSDLEKHVKANFERHLACLDVFESVVLMPHDVRNVCNDIVLAMISGPARLTEHKKSLSDHGYQ
jgi:hypothetical protein